MGVEAVLGRGLRVLGHQLQFLVELRHAPRVVPLRTTHHGDQETAAGKRVELAGDGGKRRVSRPQEAGIGGLRDVPEENLLLAFQETQQPARGEDLPIAGEPHMVRLVPGLTRARKGSTRDHLAVAGRLLVEVDHQQEIGRLAGLIPRPNVQVLLRYRQARSPGYRPQCQNP